MPHFDTIHDYSLVSADVSVIEEYPYGIPRMSMSRFSETLEEDGFVFLGPADFPDFSDLPIVYRQYVIGAAENQRPDIVSKKYYGNQDLYWLVCLLNDIEDPWEELLADDILYIPTLDDAYRFILTQ